MGSDYEVFEFREKRGRSSDREREGHHRSPSPSRDSKNHHEEIVDAESVTIYASDDEEWSDIEESRLLRRSSLPDLRGVGADEVERLRRKGIHHLHPRHHHVPNHHRHMPHYKNNHHGHLIRETETMVSIPLDPRHSNNSILEKDIDDLAARMVNTLHINTVGNEYATWKDPVVFRPHDATNHPREWLEKLEKLEAQIVHASAKPNSSLHEPLPTSMEEPTEARHYLRHHLRPVLVGLGNNLVKLQRSHFCDITINILIQEKDRPQVARLVDLSVSVIHHFVSNALSFIDRDEIFDLGHSTEFLRYCADILAWMSLRPRVLQQYRLERTTGELSGYQLRRLWPYSTIVPAVLHALRAASYTLDIAIVSFVGAHLEPFDEVYFAHPHQHQYYKIPCDAHTTSSIIIYRRHFDCLSGLLGDTPAWVFEAHERGQILDLGRKLYLRTAPEQLASIWGPLWRCEDLSPHGHSKYLLSHGFIVGWPHSTSDPPIHPGEYLCHWTASPTSVASSPGLPRYINIPYLLIGATHPAIETNPSCPATPSTIRSSLASHHWLHPLSQSHWYLNSSSTPVLPPSSHPYTTLLTHRRHGLTLRSLTCASLIAQPLSFLPLLSTLSGATISGCSLNSLRVPLLSILTSHTVREYVSSTCPWVRDADKWHAFKHLLSNLDGAAVYRSCTTHQRHEIEKVIKVVFGTFKDMDEPSGRHRGKYWNALYASGGTGYIASIPGHHHEWVGLFADSIEGWTAAVVEARCYECETGGLVCRTEGGRRRREVPGSVFETAVWLNREAALPGGLRPFRETGVVTRDMVKSVPRGEVLDLGDYGRLRVLAHVRVAEPHGSALVVEWKRAGERWPRKVKCFTQKVKGQIDQELYHAERRHFEESVRQCVYVLVVSDPADKEIADWLDDLR